MSFGALGALCVCSGSPTWSPPPSSTQSLFHSLSLSPFLPLGQVIKELY